MKYILLLLCLVVSDVSAYTSKDVFRIYKRLLVSNPDVRPLNIAVRSGATSWCSMACTNGVTITISTELLGAVFNEAELSGVIGHEMAHARYRSELQADVLGLQYASRAGYSYCLAAQLLKRYLADDEHPSGDLRYKNSKCS